MPAFRAACADAVEARRGRQQQVSQGLMPFLFLACGRRLDFKCVSHHLRPRGDGPV